MHIEQTSATNADWKYFGLKLGTLLQQRTTDFNRCIVKMSSPHLLRAGGVMHDLGDETTEELRLVPASYSKKGRKPQSARQGDMDYVEPSSSDSGSEQNEGVTHVDYKRRKEMSADIFRYLVISYTLMMRSNQICVGVLFAKCRKYRSNKWRVIQTLTRMWANAQRDGRPAEYRWRPMFNAAKFG